MELRAVMVGAVIGAIAAFIHAQMMQKGGLKYT